MDYIDLRAYIASQKTQLQDYKDNLAHTENFQKLLETNKPVKWYNGVYYQFKIFSLYTFSVLLILTVLLPYIYAEEFRVIFDDLMGDVFSFYIEDMFGSKLTSLINSDNTIGQAINSGLREHMLEDIFDIFRFIYCLIVIFMALLLIYIARLTKKLHQKNDVIKAYYKSNLDYITAYKEVIKNKKEEIEFLDKINIPQINKNQFYYYK